MYTEWRYIPRYSAAFRLIDRFDFNEIPNRNIRVRRIPYSDIHVRVYNIIIIIYVDRMRISETANRTDRRRVSFPHYRPDMRGL